ncbi:hypothetical protein FB45DRAFT_929482 [Roridomyces roridus]|uniref:Uncharacterized protein n=1 Tax=Roridomyces roridus TaxID=1738132 RepID=A0AAD7FI46_9AGAR|nr:hypothetical protein FB45DRAFT_929482 [Roridomyces roridus]
MVEHSTQALLPPELERVIFELAAYTRPLSIPRLMLVAWRVKAWVEPLLYRVLLLTDPKTWYASRAGLHGASQYPYQDDHAFSQIFAIPPSVLQTSVQHLCLLQIDQELAHFLLSNCLSVHDLWLLTNLGTSLDLVGALRLKRLHYHITDIFQNNTVDFTHSLFLQITHLEIFDSPRDLPDGSWSNLALIPNLTHLAFNDDGFLPLLPSVLRACASLRVLALVMPSSSPVRVQISDELTQDMRFVWMACDEYIRDWHQGALTGEDYWARAEAFIDRRRRGDLTDPLQYWIERDASQRLP